MKTSFSRYHRRYVRRRRPGFWMRHEKWIRNCVVPTLVDSLGLN